MTEIAPPSSVVIGALESSTEIRVFDEGVSMVPLVPDLFFDHIGPGLFDDSPPVIFYSMPKGAMLNSYLVHFDPVGSGFATASGGITFDPGETIIGIQAHTPNIFSTDTFFGDPGVTYPTAGSDATRGMDSFSLVYDSGIVALDLNSVTFEFKAELGVDEVRIFTAVTPVPVPAAAWLGLAGIAGIVTVRRIRR